MKRKGLSQVLWLIIAAAVLMMVSMALTFTTQGTLGDFASSADENQCRQTLENQLASHANGDVVLAPRSCYSDQGNPIAYSGRLNNEDGDASTRNCIVKQSNGWEVTGEATSASNCPT